MSSSSWRKSPCRESCLPGFWGGSPACAQPVPRVEVGPLRQPSPKAVAGRPRCAARGDFEVYVAEKSRLRRLQGLVKRGQEFNRVGNALLRTLRRSTVGLKTRNCGPGRRLSGKVRIKDRKGGWFRLTRTQKERGWKGACRRRRAAAARVSDSADSLRAGGPVVLCYSDQ